MTLDLARIPPAPQLRLTVERGVLVLELFGLKTLMEARSAFLAATAGLEGPDPIVIDARATDLVPRRADLVRMGREFEGSCPFANRAIAFVVRPGAQTRSARMLATLAWAEGGRAWEFAGVDEAISWLRSTRNGLAFAPRSTGATPVGRWEGIAQRPL